MCSRYKNTGSDSGKEFLCFEWVSTSVRSGVLGDKVGSGVQERILPQLPGNMGRAAPSWTSEAASKARLQ